MFIDAPLIYDEDIEDDRKRQMRVEERASRSARFIYMLTCQSNELQEEIKKLDKKSKIDAKKVNNYILERQETGILMHVQIFTVHCTFLNAHAYSDVLPCCNVHMIHFINLHQQSLQQ